MKSLLLGIVIIVIVGFGGLVYRNAVEYPNRHIKYSPPSTQFPDVHITFVLPEGFSPVTPPDTASVAAYEKAGPTPQEPSHIIIRRFIIPASSNSTSSPQASVLAVIKETAIGGTSGEPVPAMSFSSIVLGSYNFTVVAIDRFEAVIDTAYYLARGTDVLRFDAIDRGVVNWTDPNLDISALPANAALRELLTTLDGG